MDGCLGMCGCWVRAVQGDVTDDAVALYVFYYVLLLLLFVVFVFIMLLIVLPLIFL